MKKLVKVAAETVHSLVFVIGCWAVYDFASARHPTATKAVLIALVMIVGGVFLWFTAVRPFLEGLREGRKDRKAKYLISFPSAAMVVPAGELEAVGRDARAVIDEAKAAGVHVFAGGIDAKVPPVRVSADGRVVDGGYPSAPPLNGGFTVLELPTREEAVAWAARIAKACRCDQELRVFGSDRQS